MAFEHPQETSNSLTSQIVFVDVLSRRKRRPTAKPQISSCDLYLELLADIRPRLVSAIAFRSVLLTYTSKIGFLCSGMLGLRMCK